MKTVLFWLAGGLDGRGWVHLRIGGLVMLGGCAILFASARVRTSCPWATRKRPRWACPCIPRASSCSPWPRWWRARPPRPRGPCRSSGSWRRTPCGRWRAALGATLLPARPAGALLVVLADLGTRVLSRERGPASRIRDRFVGAPYFLPGPAPRGRAAMSATPATRNPRGGRPLRAGAARASWWTASRSRSAPGKAVRLDRPQRRRQVHARARAGRPPRPAAGEVRLRGRRLRDCGATRWRARSRWWPRTRPRPPPSPSRSGRASDAILTRGPASLHRGGRCRGGARPRARRRGAAGRFGRLGHTSWPRAAATGGGLARGSHRGRAPSCSWSEPPAHLDIGHQLRLLRVPRGESAAAEGVSVSSPSCTIFPRRGLGRAARAPGRGRGCRRRRPARDRAGRPRGRAAAPSRCAFARNTWGTASPYTSSTNGPPAPRADGRPETCR